MAGETLLSRLHVNKGSAQLSCAAALSHASQSYRITLSALLVLDGTVGARFLWHGKRNQDQLTWIVSCMYGGSMTHYRQRGTQESIWDPQSVFIRPEK